MPDTCDLAVGSSQDENGNRIPDECDQCTGEGQCSDNDVCTWDYCDAGTCKHAAVAHGDVNADGIVNLADIFCILDALAGRCGEGFACSCVNADVAPCPGGNGHSDVFDIFAILDTIAGATVCECAGG